MAAAATDATRASPRRRPRALPQPPSTRTLAEADADERLGPLLGATGLRMRFEFTDAGIGLNVAAGEDGHNLCWSFADDPGWPPKLDARDELAVANRYLQGARAWRSRSPAARSAATASRAAALHYLPATRLLCRALPAGRRGATSRTCSPPSSAPATTGR